MNATPSVSQIQLPSDPAQQGTVASVNSDKSGANSQDFASALSSAGAKPTRKAAGHTAADAGTVGGQLPAPGNLSPPTTVSAVAGGAATSASAFASAGAVGDTSTSGPAAPTVPAVPVAGSPAAGSTAAAAAPAVGPTAAGVIAGAPAAINQQETGSTLPGLPSAAPGAQGSAAGPAAAFAIVPGFPGADPGAAGAPGGEAAGDASATIGLAATPLAGAAPNPGTAQTAPGAAASAQTGVAVSAAAAGIARATAGTSTAGAPTARATTAAINAATSAPSTTDGNTPSTNDGTGTSTDAAAQAVAASAQPAAATATGISGDAAFAGAADSPSLPADDLATPAAGAVAHGIPGPHGAAVSASAASAGSPAAAAAKAAANGSALTTLVNAGASDKHASGANGDSLLPGTSADGAAGAAQLGLGTTGAADAAPTPTLKVAAGMDTPEFGQGLADRVTWMIDNNLNGAKLQVNPAQLGPIELRIAVQGNHAQVWMTSHSAVTRDALEANSPKLREMLGAHGFGQVSVDISQRSYQDRSPQSQPYQWTPSASRGSAAPAAQSSAASLPRISSGAVDAYA
jgi:flagellar hook-length control protein FliK